jgi:thiamine-phosphate pyrophosphorylase
LPRAGLYVITDGRLIPEGKLLDQVEQAIAGGAVLVQYREKFRNRQERYRDARALVALCTRRKVPLIVNDDVALALAVEAHGVHLGRHDTSIQQARQRLGPRAIIGISCYNHLELAQRAAVLGASYVAFGRFYASKTKPQAVHALPSLLLQARREIELPIAAIGGITPENGGELLSAGATLLAVIHGVFGQPDVRVAARNYSALFEREYDL